MQPDFTIRGYRPGDEHLLLEMFNEVFHQSRDIRHWYWKYRDHPWGQHCFSLAVAPDGRLAAHYGGYPVKMISHSPQGARSEFISFQIADKMSRPCFRDAGFRKQGVLARAFFHFRAHFGRDAPFAYGFGTHHSLRLGLLLFDYMNVERVPLRKLPLRLGQRTWRQRAHSAISRIRVEEISRIDEDWTRFFHQVAPYYGCLTVRDAAYLNWRYLLHPDRQYLVLALRRDGELVGWSVFAKNQMGIQWVDALFHPRYARSARSLLDCLQRHPFAADASHLYGWFPPRPDWWNAILNDLGFVSEKEPNDLHLTGPVFNDPQSETFLRHSWYYTMGDSDLF